LLGKGDL
ncbi:hypothetical protein MIMGU_mgv1a0089762mg, partial [Erythranthe guttata]